MDLERYGWTSPIRLGTYEASEDTCILTRTMSEADLVIGNEEHDKEEINRR
jgi:hypothetical protein